MTKDELLEADRLRAHETFTGMLAMMDSPKGTFRAQQNHEGNFLIFPATSGRRDLYRIDRVPVWMNSGDWECATRLVRERCS